MTSKERLYAVVEEAVMESCPMCAERPRPSNNGELCGECEAYCISICEEGV